MNATTVAVDLAKSVFQLAVADTNWRVVETHRLTRTQFERWFANRDVSHVHHGSLRLGPPLGALANKLARICYATLRDKAPFGEGQRLSKKLNRESFVMPA